jgi:hypothetical protein
LEAPALVRRRFGDASVGASFADASAALSSDFFGRPLGLEVDFTSHSPQ